MADGVIFAAVFVGFFILRLVATTVFFLFIMDEGPSCPACGGETLRIHAPLLRRLVPQVRSSWCPGCSWEGWLRNPSGGGGQPAAPANSESQPGHPPGISKKSS